MGTRVRPFLQEQLAAERVKNSVKQKDDSTTANRMTQRNQDVARYQKENRLLAAWGVTRVAFSA